MKTAHDNEKKITLTISTSAGDWTHEFNTNKPLHAVKTEAMAQLKLDPSTAKDYCLVIDGQRLDENKTIAEQGLKDGTVIFLERCEVVKI